MRLILNLATAAAVLLALAIAAAGPLTRLGIIDYVAGLAMIRQAALPVLIAAGAAAVLGLVGLSRKMGSAATLAIISAVLAAAAGAVPLKMKADFEKNPFIHDVTTDFDNPPQIIAAADLPRKNPAAYRGADPVPQSTDGLTVAEAQKKAFPDILPITVEADLKTAAAAAKETLAAMEMETLADGPADAAAGGGWRIEAVATSRWFGFKDDFIVRLTPLEVGGTRVDLRSKSRVGGSDLGANARRVRDFTKRFRAAMD